MRPRALPPVALTLATALLAATYTVRLAAAEIDPAEYQAHVRYLASDELKGRATGSPELEVAAGYIADRFEAAGLQPIGDNATYYQEFTATVGSHLGTANRFQAHLGDNTSTFELDKDFTAFSFSSSGTVESAPVVFAGYGITAEEYGYDDYAGIDVTGKFALILRHEPQEEDEDSVFDGSRTSPHATFANKAVNAKLHGAAGVILINDTYAHSSSPDVLVPYGSADGPTDAGVLFLQISASDAEEWIEAQGRDLEQIEHGIDANLQPQSFELSNVTVSATVEIVRERKAVHNVVGYLPGATDEYIIIGAHYDHLGLGDEHSLAPSEVGQIHHGADDNASGTAGVVELAEYFAMQPQLKRGILFMTFAGEEIGLLGSAHFASNPLLPLENAVTMLNMDMIGRISDGKVYVNGTGTGSTLDALVNSIDAPDSLKIDLSESPGYGGSDHISFSAKQVPILFFFSGLHGDYHKPSDTSDKINSEAAADLVGYVAEIATRLASADDRPVFQRVSEPANAHGGSPGDTPVSSGYGPSFGSVPDFNEPETGVRFADVRAGTPADAAGLIAGDILIEFDGQKIGNLYDFTYALQSQKAGNEVLVKVLREGQPIEAKVLLTERR